MTTVNHDSSPSGEEVALEAYRFAQAMALTAKARGNHGDERAWLDLLHLLDKAAKHAVPAPVAVPSPAPIGEQDEQYVIALAEEVWDDEPTVAELDLVRTILAAQQSLAPREDAPRPESVATDTRCTAQAADPITTRTPREDGYACGRTAGHSGEHVLYSADGESVLYAGAWKEAEPVVAPLPTEAIIEARSDSDWLVVTEAAARAAAEAHWNSTTTFHDVDPDLMPWDDLPDHIKEISLIRNRAALGAAIPYLLSVQTDTVAVPRVTIEKLRNAYYAGPGRGDRKMEIIYAAEGLLDAVDDSKDNS